MARMLALIGLLFSLAGERRGWHAVHCKENLKGRLVLSALAGAAQLRAIVKSSCWCIIFCTLTTVITQERMGAGPIL
jgi:hypothetical protein